jgi:two-component system, OmpR family, response regulator
MTTGCPKVLVVDDEDGIGDLLEYGLGSAGFSVTVAPDGSSALEATKQWAPDAILLDVMLPDIDGFALFPRLRSLTASPIIFLTAKVEAEERAAGLRLGAFHYVTKPFDLDELIGCLRTAIRRV